MRFEGRVAIVTAAGSGIGRATTEIMAREGATVVAVDNAQNRLDDLQNWAGGGGNAGRVETRLCDALDPAQAGRLVADTLAAHGRIDILVNAVGGSTIIADPGATVDALSRDDWQRIIAFNLDGTFLFTNAVVPAMRRQGGGKIVNIASIAGRGLSASSSSAYAAAKGGIIAFTRKLSIELGPAGINVNAIAPSLTLTERLRPRWDGWSAEEQAAEAAQVPLGRVAEAGDQARVICFLASADADFVTGQTIDVSGGLA